MLPPVPVFDARYNMPYNKKFAFIPNKPHTHRTFGQVFFSTQILSYSHTQTNLLTQYYWAFYLDVLNITPTSIQNTRMPIYLTTNVIFYLKSMWKYPLLLYLKTLSISLMSKFKWWADGQMHGQCMNDKGLLSFNQKILQLILLMHCFILWYMQINIGMCK